MSDNTSHKGGTRVDQAAELQEENARLRNKIAMLEPLAEQFQFISSSFTAEMDLNFP